MEWNLSSNICRCCLSQGSFKGLNLPNFWMGEEELYSVMLRECFDVTLSQSDKMSDSGICEVCITQLRNSFNFKKQVLNSEALFQARLTEHSTKVETDTEIKVEILEDHGSDNESNSDFGAERLDDLQDMEQVDMEIKYESPPEKKRGGSKRSSATLASSAPVKKSKRIKKETSAKTVASKRSARVGTSITQTVRDLRVGPRVTNRQKHTSNVTALLLCSNATPFKDCTALGYACVYCRASFVDPQALRAHTVSDHDKTDRHKQMSKFRIDGYTLKLDIAALKCTLCHKDTKDLNTLKEHLVSAHSKTIYTDIRDHVLPFLLSREKGFNCVLCAESFENFKMLLQHMNVHYRNYCCQTCSVGFATLLGLRKHEKRHETGNYPCQYCSKVFPSKMKQRYHERGVHTGSWVRIKCPHCAEKFADYHQRNKHLSSVHDVAPKVYNCRACDKVFPKKCLLTAHTKKDHLLERNFQCQHCEQRFFLKFALDEHMVKHTGQRSFVCNVCEKTYARKKALREHMRGHNNDCRYKCAVCEQAFLKKTYLVGHLKLLHPDFEPGVRNDR